MGIVFCNHCGNGWIVSPQKSAEGNYIQCPSCSRSFVYKEEQQRELMEENSRQRSREHSARLKQAAIADAQSTKPTISTDGQLTKIAWLGVAFLCLWIISGVSAIGLSSAWLSPDSISPDGRNDNTLLLLRVLCVVSLLVNLGCWGFNWLVNERPWYREFKEGYVFVGGFGCLVVVVIFIAAIIYLFATEDEWDSIKLGPRWLWRRD